MNQLTVALGDRSYPIEIRAGLLQDPSFLTSHIKSKNVVVLTNEVVGPLYCEQLQTLLSDYDVEVIQIADGEQFKSLQSFELVITKLLEMNAARDTTLIALGGGVIGDMAGFVAACYQRGIPFIQVPTTLLAQVDSSVGGKTAVNHPLGKNMIGAFYQPKAVLIDTQTLKTLPDKEFSAGMAEVIKYGIIYDAAFFVWLEENQQALKALEPNAIAYAIHRCCEIKAEIVAQDEKEGGIRALLNLGHTFGHAIEAEQGYGSWLHGEAVAAGTVLACRTAEILGWFTASETRRVAQLFDSFNLPLEAPKDMDYQAFMKHMRRDKKVLSGKIRFIIPEAIGKAVITELDEQTLQTLLA